VSPKSKLSVSEKRALVASLVSPEKAAPADANGLQYRRWRCTIAITQGPDPRRRGGATPYIEARFKSRQHRCEAGMTVFLQVEGRVEWIDRGPDTGLVSV